MSQHYYPDPPLPVNSLAVVSMVLGFISYFMLPVLGGIAAVVTGHMAKAEIKANPYHYSGEGFATVGLILGYAHLALTLITILVIISALLMLPAFATWITGWIQEIH
jgi:hypothetical protein